MQGCQQSAVGAIQETAGGGGRQSLTTNPMQSWRFVCNWTYVDFALPCVPSDSALDCILLPKSQNRNKRKYMDKNNGTNAAQFLTS